MRGAARRHFSQGQYRTGPLKWNPFFGTSTSTVFVVELCWLLCCGSKSTH